MSDDIVKRLREEQAAQAQRDGEEDAADRTELAASAADEIERLRAALERIANDTDDDEWRSDARVIAHDALAGEGGSRE